MPKDVRKLLTYHLKSFIWFEVIYKILTTIIFGPIFLFLFQLITKITGYSYLTYENFFSFLGNPITIFFLILLFLFMTFYTLIDIGTILILLDSSYQKKKMKIKEAFLLACHKSIQVFKRKNLFLPFFILFLIPFLNIGLSSGFISTIKVPEFILDFIKENPFISTLYGALIIFLSILLYRWLYVLHYFILEDCSFKEAREKSINLGKKNHIKDFLSILKTQCVIFLVYFIFVLVGILFIFLFYHFFGKFLGSVSITVVWLLIAFSFILVVLLSTPINYAIISVLFYKHKHEKKEKVLAIKGNEKEEKEKRNQKFAKGKRFFIILVFLSGTLFTYTVITGQTNLKIEYVRTMEVTAHRGASYLYPENTMSAFKGAKELGSDWIELDVQQTKDGKIVILHDTNLKRTTGLNKNTWETTYEEIQSLDAGSFFNEEFAGEKIPLLDEALAFAKENNIKLNIELKPTGHEKDFEKMVVDLIKKYDYLHQSVITSQVYEVLENVKKYEENAKTVYVMSLAYGDITNLIYADSFSIEASSITKKLVSTIHNSGKEIYAWTVNTTESIENMIDLKVDNIITDNITLAKDTIYDSKTSDLIAEYIKLINNLFH